MSLLTEKECKSNIKGDMSDCSSTFRWKTTDPAVYTLLKEFARENRKNQTDTESFLWNQLKARFLGVRFRRQYIVKGYIADFICIEKKLIIEVDGGYHFSNSQIEYDVYRTEQLEESGFKVIRFTNEQVIIETEQVINKIKELL